jgi:hypothetical protein
MPEITRQVQIWPLRYDAPVVIFPDLREPLGHAAIARRLLGREALAMKSQTRRNKKRRAKKARHRYGCTSKLNIIA